MADLSRIPQSAVLCLIQLYQWCISPLLGRNCRFYPSCSHYAQEAIIKQGVFKGIFWTGKRLLKCHPWHQGGYDPVPED